MKDQKEKSRHQFHLPKYVGINLPNDAKDLYSENCNILMKEIQDDKNGETYHILGLEESVL